MILKSIAVVLISSAALSAASFTFAESTDFDTHDETVDFILKTKEFCTALVEDGRIYLKPEHIYKCSEGIFLRTDELEATRLPKLYYSELGPYIKVINDE